MRGFSGFFSCTVRPSFSFLSRRNDPTAVNRDTYPAAARRNMMLQRRHVGNMTHQPLNAGIGVLVPDAKPSGGDQKCHYAGDDGQRQDQGQLSTGRGRRSSRRSRRVLTKLFARNDSFVQQLFLKIAIVKPLPGVEN
ncbi:hypothetical protein MTO96_038700 [Rhipicephalus appendiculatus]